MDAARRGFTLIELLVAIAIIGILSTLLLANFNAARERGRDAQRKSDLRNVQSALRLYYNDKGVYPASDSGGNILGCGSGGTGACTWGGEWSADTSTYMSTLPGDPTPGQSYLYTRVDFDTYTLDSCLENKSDDRGVVTANLTWCPSGWMYQVKP